MERFNKELALEILCFTGPDCKGNFVNEEVRRVFQEFSIMEITDIDTSTEITPTVIIAMIGAFKRIAESLVIVTDEVSKDINELEEAGGL